jgi:hypothetical protein
MARPLRIESPGTSGRVIHRGRCRRSAGTPSRRPGPRRTRRPRFLNRDPIEEAGGLNLYAFCGNDGVNRFDLLGMDGEDVFDRIRRTGGTGPDGAGGDTYSRDNPFTTTLYGSNPDRSTAEYYATHGKTTPDRDYYITDIPWEGQPEGKRIIRTNLITPESVREFWNRRYDPNSGLRTLDGSGASSASQQNVDPVILAAHQSAKGRLLGLKDTQGVEWSILIRKDVVDGKTTYSLSDPIRGTTGSVGPVALRQFQTDASVVGLSHLHTGAPQLSAYDFITAIYFGKDVSSVYGNTGELYVFPSGADRAARESYAMDWHKALEADPRMWKNTIETRFDNRPTSGTNVFFGPGTLTDF